MHSSKMCTARSVTVSHSIGWGEGVCHPRMQTPDLDLPMNADPSRCSPPSTGEENDRQTAVKT